MTCGTFPQSHSAVRGSKPVTHAIILEDCQTHHVECRTVSKVTHSVIPFLKRPVIETEYGGQAPGRGCGGKREVEGVFQVL